MKVHFELTDPSGEVVVAGSEVTRSADLSGWDNHSLVVRMLRVKQGLTPQLGQRLLMWVEVDFPDETIQRAARSFPQAVTTHVPGVTCADGRINAEVIDVVDALLQNGWIQPPEPDDIDGEERSDDKQRALNRRSALTLVPDPEAGRGGCG